MITVYLLAVNMIAKLAVVNVEIESVITAGITVCLLAVNMIAKLAVVNVEIESVITAGKCYHMSVNYLDETGPPPAHPAPRWRSVTHGRRFPTVSGR